MAKTKIDFTSIDIPAAAQKPLYAGVGAGDLAVTAVREYVADVQKKLTGFQKDAHARFEDVSKTVTDFDAKKLQETAREQAKARRAAVEARVAELQTLPVKGQAAAKEYADLAVATYADLAKRGEAVVKGTKVEVKATTATPSAKKPTKAPAVKAAATRASAPKKSTTTATPAKKVSTPRKTTAKKTTSA